MPNPMGGMGGPKPCMMGGPHMGPRMMPGPNMNAMNGVYRPVRKGILCSQHSSLFHIMLVYIFGMFLCLIFLLPKLLTQKCNFEEV